MSTNGVSAGARGLLPAGLLVILVALPQAAHAVQSHGGTEGLVAHQVGHVLFAVGLGTVLLSKRPIGLGRAGHRHFRRFLVLAICWNVLTFSGHLLQEIAVEGVYRRSEGRITHLAIDHALDALLYLSHLDHLVLIPALVFLLFALRAWRSGEGS